MEIGKRFEDIFSYNKSMSNAMIDKLFFVPKLPKDNYVFVDFGCADGIMINNLIDIFGCDCKYIGYDCSKTMIDLAKTNFRENAQAIFTTNWNDVTSFLERNSSFKKVLIASSVIHEVYSYAKSNNDIIKFWNKVKNTGFEYIIIRDMMPRKNLDGNTLQSDLNKILDKAKLDLNFSSRLNEFCSIYGPISLKKNFVHFLLKYKWATNWNREVNENYFPITVEDLLEIIKEPPYQLIYLENFKLKFLCDQIKKDFNINLLDNTHIKLIFKKIL